MDQQAVDQLHAQISQLQGEIERLRSTLHGIVKLYKEDEGCKSLPKYIEACAVLEETK
jgi:prefoldin subunit 5